jgi:methionine aminopeptidase
MSKKDDTYVSVLHENPLLGHGEPAPKNLPLRDGKLVKIDSGVRIVGNPRPPKGKEK